MGGKIRSISTHGSPPSQSSPFKGEEVLLDNKELRKCLPSAGIMSRTASAKRCSQPTMNL